MFHNCIGIWKSLIFCVFCLIIFIKNEVIFGKPIYCEPRKNCWYFRWYFWIPKQGYTRIRLLHLISHKIHQILPFLLQNAVFILIFPFLLCLFLPKIYYQFIHLQLFVWSFYFIYVLFTLYVLCWFTLYIQIVNKWYFTDSAVKGIWLGNHLGLSQLYDLFTVLPVLLTFGNNWFWTHVIVELKNKLFWVGKILFLA